MSEISILSKVSSISHFSSNNDGLLSLPIEILFLIFGNLDGHSLTRCSQTCKRLRHISEDDLLWSRLVSPLHVRSPAPYNSYKNLYKVIQKQMWLHGKLWYGDRHPTGTLLVSRYSPVTGGIALFRVKVLNPDNNDPTPIANFSQENGHICEFDANIGLGITPVISIPSSTSLHASGEIFGEFEGEQKYYTLERVISPCEKSYPPSIVRFWPPENILTKERIPDSWSRTPELVVAPSKQLSEDFMVLRKWLRNDENTLGGWGSQLESMHLSTERTETFAALNEKLFTPDEENPFRGLWVCGSEIEGYLFLHLQQTGDRVEAVRLTGDYIIPRGKESFIIPSVKNVVRTTDELEWIGGVKVVPAISYVADSGFNIKRMKESSVEMYLINENELAVRGEWAWANTLATPPPDEIVKLKRVPIGELLRSGKMRLGRGVEIGYSVSKTAAAELNTRSP